MKKIFPYLLAVAGLAAAAYAVETSIWQQNEYSDFERGSLKNLSVRSDGRLSLAPVFTEVLDSSSAYLWALAEDSKGNLFAGGGGPGGPGARVYMRTPNGQSKVLAELEGLEVHAIAIDQKDRIYAATSPDGKVYRITAGGKSEVFFEPGAKYIWAMAFNRKGDLFVATGDEGLVYRVTADGKGDVFFKTEETHARSLAIDANDNVIVGTEPGGLILRISPKGQGFVLYQAPKSEITAVAVAKDGAIYAAGVGTKKPFLPILAPPPPIQVTPVPTQSGAGVAPTVQATRPSGTPPPSLSPALPSVGGGSDVYRIAADGYPKKVWSQEKDIAYTIGFDAEGRPLVGTGNQGVVYRLDSDVLYTALLTAPPTQVIGLFAGRKGEVYATTGNIGKVYRLGPGIEKEGSIESDVFDAGIYSTWGRLSFRGTVNGGSIRFETRSGNLDRPRKDWSPWEAVPLEGDGGRVQSPKARFLQWKLTLASSADGLSPELESVDAAYLPRNVAPVIEQIEVTPANYRFPPQSLTLTPSQTITLQPLGGRRSAPHPKPITVSGSVTMQYAKGEIGARWAASDENEDDLLYKVEIRGLRETQWKLLKDKIKDKHLSWNSTAFPDGEYALRVTASDSPDNPPDQALSAQLVSDAFLIDNTPPEITGLSASQTGNTLEVRWNAKDAHSILQRAEYSVNGGEWAVVEPVAKLSDSRSLEYSLSLAGLPPGEKTVAVRVTDDYDNQSVASVVVR